ncbi:MAG: hypothetical protein V4568_00755 [Pseudomonadota bacterium]
MARKDKSKTADASTSSAAEAMDVAEAQRQHHIDIVTNMASNKVGEPMTWGDVRLFVSQAVDSHATSVDDEMLERIKQLADPKTSTTDADRLFNQLMETTGLAEKLVIEKRPDTSRSQAANLHGKAVASVADAQSTDDSPFTMQEVEALKSEFSSADWLENIAAGKNTLRQWAEDFVPRYMDVQDMYKKANEYEAAHKKESEFPGEEEFDKIFEGIIQEHSKINAYVPTENNRTAEAEANSPEEGDETTENGEKVLKDVTETEEKRRKEKALLRLNLDDGWRHIKQEVEGQVEEVLNELIYYKDQRRKLKAEFMALKLEVAENLDNLWINGALYTHLLEIQQEALHRERVVSDASQQEGLSEGFSQALQSEQQFQKHLLKEVENCLRVLDIKQLLGGDEQQLGNDDLESNDLRVVALLGEYKTLSYEFGDYKGREKLFPDNLSLLLERQGAKWTNFRVTSGLEDNSLQKLQQEYLITQLSSWSWGLVVNTPLESTLNLLPGAMKNEESNYEEFQKKALALRQELDKKTPQNILSRENVETELRRWEEEKKRIEVKLSELRKLNRGSPPSSRWKRSQQSLEAEHRRIKLIFEQAQLTKRIIQSDEKNRADLENQLKTKDKELREAQIKNPTIRSETLRSTIYSIGRSVSENVSETEDDEDVAIMFPEYITRTDKQYLQRGTLKLKHVGNRIRGEVPRDELHTRLARAAERALPSREAALRAKQLNWQQANAQEIMRQFLKERRLSDDQALRALSQSTPQAGATISDKKKFKAPEFGSRSRSISKFFNLGSKSRKAENDPTFKDSLEKGVVLLNNVLKTTSTSLLTTDQLAQLRGEIAEYILDQNRRRNIRVTPVSPAKHAASFLCYLGETKDKKNALIAHFKNGNWMIRELNRKGTDELINGLRQAIADEQHQIKQAKGRVNTNAMSPPDRDDEWARELKHVRKALKMQSASLVSLTDQLHDNFPPTVQQALDMHNAIVGWRNIRENDLLPNIEKLSERARLAKQSAAGKAPQKPEDVRSHGRSR